MGLDYNNRQAANWGGFSAPKLAKGAQEAFGYVDPKQKPLVRAIASLIYNAAADLYGDNKDPKYRYIVDLILDRIRDAIYKQLSNLSETQLEAQSKNNEALLKSIGNIVSETIKEAFDKLPNGYSQKDTETLLASFQKKLDDVAKNLKNQIQSSSDSKDSKKASEESSKTDDLVFNQQQINKSIEQLKQQLSKQFSADNASNAINTNLNKSGKSSFEAATSAILSKQLTLLARNQKIISQNMTKSFEKTNKTISSDVSKLHKTTAMSFYSLNDKLEDSLSKFSRSITRFGSSLVTGIVSGTVVALTFSLKKTFGAIFTAIESVSKGLFSLFKAPVSFLGSILKKILFTPIGASILLYFGKYIWNDVILPVWNNVILPIWNEFKPIIDIFSDWIKNKISFPQVFDLIAKYAVAELSKLWDSLKDTWQNVKDPIKDFLSDYFGYDKEKPFWKNISAGFDFCWNATKESIKQFLAEYCGYDISKSFWQNIGDVIERAFDKVWNGMDGSGGLQGIIKRTFGCPANQDLLDYIFNTPLDSFLGIDVTPKRLLIAMATMYGLKKVGDLAIWIASLGKAIGAIAGFFGIGSAATAATTAAAATATAATTTATTTAAVAGGAGLVGSAVVAEAILAPVLTTALTAKAAKDIDEYKNASVADRARMMAEHQNSLFKGQSKWFKMIEAHEAANRKEAARSLKQKIERLDEAIKTARTSAAGFDPFDFVRIFQEHNSDLLSHSESVDKMVKFIDTFSIDDMKEFEETLKYALDEKYKIAFPEKVVAKITEKQKNLLEQQKQQQLNLEKEAKQQTFKKIEAKLASFSKIKSLQSQLEKAKSDREKSDDELTSILGDVPSLEELKIQKEINKLAKESELSKEEVSAEGFMKLIRSEEFKSIAKDILPHEKDDFQKLVEQAARSIKFPVSELKFDDFFRSSEEKADKIESKVDDVGKKIEKLADVIVASQSGKSQAPQNSVAVIAPTLNFNQDQNSQVFMEKQYS